MLDAQAAAAEAFKPNGTAANVDIAARTVIENAGYGYGFTHRLGHGIGIKGKFQLRNFLMHLTNRLTGPSARVSLSEQMEHERPATARYDLHERAGHLS